MNASDRDLLVSAVLDGEASPDEVAQVRDDPELAARLEALRSVREQLRDAPAVTPPPGAADAAVAAALDHDELVVARRSRWRRVAPIVAAAAAAMLVILGIGTILRSSTSTNGSTSQTAAGSAPTTTAAGAPADSSAPTRQLGAFADPDTLVVAATSATASERAAQPEDRALSASAPVTPSTAPPTASAADGNRELAPAAGAVTPTSVPCALAAPGQLLLRADAVLDGRPVDVFVFTTGPTTIVQVDDASTCEVVLSRPV